MLCCGDRFYLDGSLSDCLPLPRLLSLGCRYIVVVLTKPLSFRSRGVSRPVRALAWWATRQFSPALKRALFDVNLHFNRTMSVLTAPAEGRLHEAVRILVIAPRSEEQLVRCVTTDPWRLRRCAGKGERTRGKPSASGPLSRRIHSTETTRCSGLFSFFEAGRPSQESSDDILLVVFCAGT
jgi:hypothetical protein